MHENPRKAERTRMSTASGGDVARSWPRAQRGGPESRCLAGSRVPMEEDLSASRPGRVEGQTTSGAPAQTDRSTRPEAGTITLTGSPCLRVSDRSVDLEADRRRDRTAF